MTKLQSRILGTATIATILTVTLSAFTIISDVIGLPTGLDAVRLFIS